MRLGILLLKLMSEMLVLMMPRELRRVQLGILRLLLVMPLGTMLQLGMLGMLPVQLMIMLVQLLIMLVQLLGITPELMLVPPCAGARIDDTTFHLCRLYHP